MKNGVDPASGWFIMLVVGLAASAIVTALVVGTWAVIRLVNRFT